MAETTLIFLDTETTGNDVTKDRLCQVCYRVHGEIRCEYFKPSLPMSVKSMSVTHITNRMLEGKPAFSESQMKKDLEGLLEDGVLVAHNAKFDIAILEAEGLSVPRHICTLRVARFLDEKGIIPEYNLQFLRYYLDLEVPGSAHDAEGDVNVLCAVFERLLQKIMKDVDSPPSQNSGEAKEAAIQKMIDISSKPSLYKTFNFGKHKEKTIEEVMKTDPGYLSWLLNQKKAANDNDEDWIYTLEHYLGTRA
ncbi:MAG: Exonuclease RNase and polymerase [Parcubacteria group bacterium]|nr:Exonuclease RNase and polymerase [Parcubacteria group bacterium]